MQLQKQDSDCITLNDLSEIPLLTLIKSGKDLITEIHYKDTQDTGSFTLKSSSSSTELSDIYNKIQQFDKCW